MRIWFDTEFIEDGKTIDLISIGLVREDGATLYFENAGCDLSLANEWVHFNVIPSLERTKGRHSQVENRDGIAQAVVRFAGEKPEFWAYYADYDWVALCQLYGRMIDLPTGWPMYCRDVQQELDRRGLKKPEHIVNSGEHHALYDACWTRSLHLWIEEQS